MSLYEWVSVEERMPWIGSDVIAFMPRAYQKVDVVRCYNNGRRQPTWADGWNKGQTHEVTHWMPLPQTPEDA